MMPTRSGDRHLLVMAVLTALSLAFIGLAAMVSIWYLVPVPLLAGGAYAAWLGMTPGRFVDAIDGDASGGGARPFPF